MKNFFRRLFHIYAGEEKNALLFACLGYVWALAVTLGLKFADALFLIHVGAESLNYVYIFSACLMMLLAGVLLKAFHNINAHRIYTYVLTAGILLYTTAFIGFSTGFFDEVKWIWFAFRIVGTISFSIGITCFWTVVDQYYHLQDAKRLYSLFSSAIFLGVATTGLIMRSEVMNVTMLCGFIVVLLFYAIYWLKRIVKSVPPIFDEEMIFETAGEQNEQSFRYLLQSIGQSRFTQLLMASNFLILILLVITEYSYLTAFDHHFNQGHPIPQGAEQSSDLTLFLGQCVAGVSILNLILGLFLYSRLVRRIGITQMILFTPIVSLMNYLGWIEWDLLLFPVIGFFVVEGMLYIIDDNNFTLLLSAVPQKMKYKIRLIIESFFEPIGMLVSSLLLTFLPIDSKIIGLVIASLALLIALLLRRKYLKALYLNLSENAIHFQRTTKEWFQTMTSKKKSGSERRLLAILQRADLQSQLLAIEGLLGLDDKNLILKMLQMVDHLSHEAKYHFVKLISHHKLGHLPEIQTKLKKWQTETRENTLSDAILFYLAVHGLLPPEKVREDLESPNLILRCAAIISFKRPWPHLSAGTIVHNQSIAFQQIQMLLESKAEDQINMGLLILGMDPNPLNVDILLPFLNHTSSKVARRAAQSIANAPTLNSTHAHILIKHLASRDTEVRQACLQALAKIANPDQVTALVSASIHFRPNERRALELILFRMGSPIETALLNLTKDIALHDRSRVLAGRVLGRLSLPLLRQHLYEIMTAEIERAYFYFYHYHTIQAQYQNIDLTLLRDTLISSYHSVMDFIIQLLGVAGESDDCDLLSRSLRSHSPKVRSHVLEALERTCEPQIFRLLYPLVAKIPQEEKINAYTKTGRKSYNLSELLDHLSKSSIQADQIVAIAIKYKLNMPDWKESLKNKNEEIFQHFATELLQS